MLSLKLVVLCFVIKYFQGITGQNITGPISEVFHASSSVNDKSVREQAKQSLESENVNNNNEHDLNIKFKVEKRDTFFNDLLIESPSALEKANVRLEGGDEKTKTKFHHKKRIQEEGERVRTHRHAVLIELKKRTPHEVERVSVCSGSLLAPKWVITAAHCFNLSYSSAIVYAGGNSLSELENETTAAKGSQQTDQITVVTHPMYDPSRKAYYDIALVQLWGDGFTYTETVKPVVFSLNYWNHRTFQKCHITDFGPDSQDMSLLQDVSLYFRKTRNLLIESSCRCFDSSRKRLMLCSKTNRTVHGGICSAVSGGGLICDEKLVAVAAGFQTVVDIDTCEVDTATYQSCYLYETRTFSTFHQLCPYMPWISAHVESVDLSSGQPLDSNCYEFHKSTGNGRPDDDRPRDRNNGDTTTSNILILTFSLQLLFLTGNLLIQ